MRKIWLTIWMALIMLETGLTQDRYVSLNGNNNPPHTNWETAAWSIKAAVDLANANPGYTVWVSTGRYDLAGVVTVQNTSVRGFSMAPEDVVVNGGGVTRCFVLDHAGAKLEALTVSNGFSSVNNMGAGVHLTVNGGTVLNCIIGWNSGFFPGGIDVFGRGLVSNCLIIANSAALNSAGVRIEANFGGLMATVACCRIVGNVSGNGAGVNMSGGTLRDCTISSNLMNATSSGNGGGGIFINNGTPTNYFAILNCLIEGNTSYSYGGGIRSQPFNLMRYIENTTIRSNVSGAFGGGGGYFQDNIALRSCLVEGNNFTGATASAAGVHLMDGAKIENCTIANNSSKSAGAGGVYLGGAVDGVFNTIAHSNQLGATFADVALASASYTNSFWHCCAGAGTNLTAAQGNITESPRWVAPSERNYGLQADSPCLNRGSNEIWMTNALDLNGLPRVDHLHRVVDIGAYERLSRCTLILAR